jgi:hypothetical protein
VSDGVGSGFDVGAIATRAAVRSAGAACAGASCGAISATQVDSFCAEIADHQPGDQQRYCNCETDLPMRRELSM